MLLSDDYCYWSTAIGELSVYVVTLPAITHLLVKFHHFFSCD
jgi:hypothetical protein